MKVAIIDGSMAYRTLFERLGHEIVLAIEDADFVCFTGGEDVSPTLYGHPKHPTTYNSLYRDEREEQAFRILQDRGIPSVGICRGGQFLNVMSGGQMYQDCTSHTRPHDLIDSTTGEVVLVTSTHHQMMKPGKNAIIVATAHEGGTRTWWDGSSWIQEDSEEDYEVLYYPDTACLCFQPHPEMMINSDKFLPMRNYFNSVLEQWVIGEIA